MFILQVREAGMDESVDGDGWWTGGRGDRMEEGEGGEDHGVF